MPKDEGHNYGENDKEHCTALVSTNSSKANVVLNRSCSKDPDISSSSFIYRKNVIHHKREEILKFVTRNVNNPDLNKIVPKQQQEEDDVSAGPCRKVSHNKEHQRMIQTIERQEEEESKSSLFSCEEFLTNYYGDIYNSDDDSASYSSISIYREDDEENDDDTTTTTQTTSSTAVNLWFSNALSMEDDNDDADNHRIEATTNASFDDSLDSLLADVLNFSDSSRSENEGDTTDDDIASNDIEEKVEEDESSYVWLDLQKNQKRNNLNPTNTYGLDNVLNTVIGDVVPHVIKTSAQIQRTIKSNPRSHQ